MVRGGTPLFTVRYYHGQAAHDRFLARNGVVRKDLIACSLVCRTWVARTRSHLFETVTIRSMSQFTLFVESTTSSTFYQHLQKLVIDVGEEWNQSWIALIPARLSPILGQVKLLAVKNIDLSEAHPSIYRIFSLFRPLEELSLETVRCHQYSQLTRLAYSTQARYINVSDPSYSHPLDKGHIDVARTFSMDARLSRVIMRLSWSELVQLSRCWSFLQASIYVVLDVYGTDMPKPYEFQRWDLIWRRLSGLFERMSYRLPLAPSTDLTQTLCLSFREKLALSLNEDIIEIDDTEESGMYFLRAFAPLFDTQA